MPLLSRLIIKTALVYLMAALLLGIGLALPGLGWIPGIAAFGASQVHLLVLGWLTQLIFGVAFWLFPRHSKERPFGTTSLVWAGYVCLNAGLLVRLVSEPFLAAPPFSLAAVLSAASTVLQWAGGMLFAAYTWTRVRER